MYNLFLSNLISFLLLFYLGNSLLKCKIKDLYSSILICAFFALIATICTNLTVSLRSTTILTISYLLYFICFFRGTLKKYALIFLYFICANAVSEILSANFVNLLSDLGPNDINTVKYTAAVLISGLLSYIMSKLFIRMFKAHDLKILPRYTYLILVLPICTMALILDIQEYFEIIRFNALFILILLGLLISNFITVSVFLKFANASKLENELLIVKKESELSNAKYEVLNNQFNRNYYFLHNTVRSLMKLINSNLENRALKEQLYVLNNKLVRGLNIINSNSLVISTILNDRLSEILEYKIDFKTVIEYNDFTFLENYIQRDIFTSLLNISIEQCKRIKNSDRFTVLKTKKLGQQVIIQLLLSHCEFSELTTDIYSNLKKTVNKLNGDLSFQNNFCNESNDSFLIVFDT